MKTTQPPAVERLAYTVKDALQSGCFPNRNKLYLAIARGDIATWKDGRSRMISAQSLRHYVEKRAQGGEASTGRPGKAA